MKWTLPSKAVMHNLMAGTLNFLTYYQLQNINIVELKVICDRLMQFEFVLCKVIHMYELSNYNY
jgi:hypothetical protein